MSNFMDVAGLEILIERYFIANPVSIGMGRLTDKIEFENINKKVLKNIPEWYRDILIKYPLVDLEIGIPNDFGDEELKGNQWKKCL